MAAGVRYLAVPAHLPRAKPETMASGSSRLARLSVSLSARDSSLGVVGRRWSVEQRETLHAYLPTCTVNTKAHLIAASPRRPIIRPPARSARAANLCRRCRYMRGRVGAHHPLLLAARCPHLDATPLQRN